MPPSGRNRDEYEKRVNRVVDYIRTHRTDELGLETLARVAAFSPFHFHRIFKSMTGENLREFIQRTRLEAAASQLRTRRNADITEIALDNGFGSPSAFARAFKERFGVTASAYRNPGQADRKPGEADIGAPLYVPSHTMEETLNVTIKNLPGYRVAYMRATGPYGTAGKIQDTWIRLIHWALAHDLWGGDDRTCIGMALDDPMVTEPDKCRYDACIVLPPGVEPDGAVNVAEVPGGKHATAPFAGGAEAIGAAWNELFGRWLPESGYQPTDTCFELYTGDFWDTKTGQFRCDLCIPVKPL